LRASRIDEVADNDQAGGYANTGLQRDERFQLCHRRDQIQPGSYRSLGVVLMRLRIAEVDRHAVAQILRHEATKPAHDLGGAFMIDRDDLAKVFRVNARGQRGRADQVGEHHRYLPALGSVFGRNIGYRNNVRRRWFRAYISAQGRNGVEQFATVPDNTYAQVL
jgi:hypothetical protein